jgi:histone acetyltransferase 1
MCLSRTDVAELTVEDPAEAFEDLRDRNDLRYLVQQGIPDDPSFLVDVGSDKKGARAQWEEGVRTKLKIAQVGDKNGPG